MRHLAAAMLLALGGKEVSNIFCLYVDENTMKEVLTAGGVKIDEAKVKAVVNSCKGKDVFKVILFVTNKVVADALKSGASAGAAKKAAPSPKKEEPKKKEEKKKEPEPVAEEEEMPLDLFG